MSEKGILKFKGAFDGDIQVGYNDFGIQFREGKRERLTLTKESAIELKEWLKIVFE